MKIDRVKDKLKGQKPRPIDVKNNYSVFIPFIEIDGKYHILYEVRAKTLRNQPGEISFPGGRIERGESCVKAAVRETSEELLIPERKIEVFSKGDFLVNPYYSVLYSVIGRINVNYEKIVPSEAEVDSIFTVPLDYLLNTEPKSYDLELSVKNNKEFPYGLIPNGKDYKFKRGRENVLFYEYEGKIIWGFTAKMTQNLIKKIKL
ncbi:ADP-ribose pyrophosphatase YjhB, NUDIX family [Anaerosphaera aminiphila DSM 21120]|uniref:ADP-ribose pyrophosphatase YjhB, NUDIX family n=1 Tax=Anaerosphaera aminiphila DSM 21120 TaxID=1120995 RepID=A0A1M5QBN2_9FIRM|nr:CoA pyrophosphatase [Anaerosphaera aminiphila]SHH11564.1 ADP-ribose pyrophosphatase YjhB, NUDIX family [Anaerosphaera aminiphila DSM 21120]